MQTRDRPGSTRYAESHSHEKGTHQKTLVRAGMQWEKLKKKLIMLRKQISTTVQPHKHTSHTHGTWKVLSALTSEFPKPPAPHTTGFPLEINTEMKVSGEGSSEHFGITVTFQHMIRGCIRGTGSRPVWTLLLLNSGCKWHKLRSGISLWWTVC